MWGLCELSPSLFTHARRLHKVQRWRWNRFTALGLRHHAVVMPDQFSVNCQFLHMYQTYKEIKIEFLTIDKNKDFRQEGKTVKCAGFVLLQLFYLTTRKHWHCKFCFPLSRFFTSSRHLTGCRDSLLTYSCRDRLHPEHFTRLSTSHC